MALDRIVCLANSYKHDNRCVAGISLITKQWIRLVSDEVEGCVTACDTCYEDGSEASILDVFEAETGDCCGTTSHPEDVIVYGRTWRLLRRFGSGPDAQFLREYVNKRDRLFASYGDRVYGLSIEKRGIGRSLELVQPEDLWWWIRVENGKRKNRALFRAGHTTRTRYELAVTDPIWLERLRTLKPGIYRHNEIVDEESSITYLTVSLSEPFQGFHYKIVAGVVQLIPTTTRLGRSPRNLELNRYSFAQ